MELQVILMFIKNNWKTIAIALMVIGCYVYVQNLRVENAYQATKIAQLEANNRVLYDNNTKLEDAIFQSNKAVERTVGAGEEAVKKFAALNSTVTQQNADLKKRLNTILKNPPPATCNATIVYLINAVGEYK